MPLPGSDPPLCRAKYDDGSLQLALRNAIGAIAAAQAAIETFGATAAMPARLQNRVEVVFEEIVSNIIRHGFDHGTAQSIAVTMTASPQRVTLCFEDDGRAFNPLTLPPPKTFGSLATAKIGGLGVATVRRLAADIDYQRVNDADGHACNRLTVTLAREPAPETCAGR